MLQLRHCMHVHEPYSMLVPENPAPFGQGPSKPTALSRCQQGLPGKCSTRYERPVSTAVSLPRQPSHSFCLHHWTRNQRRYSYLIIFDRCSKLPLEQDMPHTLLHSVVMAQGHTCRHCPFLRLLWSGGEARHGASRSTRVRRSCPDAPPAPSSVRLRLEACMPAFHSEFLYTFSYIGS